MPQRSSLARTVDVKDATFPLAVKVWQKRFADLLRSRLGDALDPDEILKEHRVSPKRNCIFFLVNEEDTTLGMACTDFVAVSDKEVPHIRGYVVKSAVQGKGYGELLLLDVPRVPGGPRLKRGNTRSVNCLKRVAAAMGRVSTKLGVVKDDGSLDAGRQAVNDDEYVEWCFAKKDPDGRPLDIRSTREDAAAPKTRSVRKIKRSLATATATPAPAPKWTKRAKKCKE
jgi:hypothetical protein